MSKSMTPKAGFSRLEPGLNVGHVHNARNDGDREAPQTPRIRKTFSPRIYEARMQVANDLREIFKEFDEDGLHQFSLAACARLAQVNESVFSDYLTGEKPMPYALDEILPWPIVRRLRQRVDARRAKRGGL